MNGVSPIVWWSCFYIFLGKSDWMFNFPLPFTLLDKILYLALISQNFLSNRVNPPSPREGGGVLGVFNDYSDRRSD
jgi:hypothetical protein